MALRRKRNKVGQEKGIRKRIDHFSYRTLLVRSQTILSMRADPDMEKVFLRRAILRAPFRSIFPAIIANR